VKISEANLRQFITDLIKEEIRKVAGGYKVYPKEPKKGDRVRKALSKKPMSYRRALRQLRAVERSKAMRETLQQKTDLNEDEALMEMSKIIKKILEFGGEEK